MVSMRSLVYAGVAPIAAVLSTSSTWKLGRMSSAGVSVFAVYYNPDENLSRKRALALPNPSGL